MSALVRSSKRITVCKTKRKHSSVIIKKELIIKKKKKKNIFLISCEVQPNFQLRLVLGLNLEEFFDFFHSSGWLEVA